MAIVLMGIGVLLILLWFFLRPGRYPEAQKALAYGANHAHRGLHSRDKAVPENSLPAFRAAVQRGYGIELDLQMTADGKIVVFHDDDLQRMCSSPLVIEQATYAQLQEYNLGETFEKIPLFSQVLAQVNGRVPLIVEIKSTERIERTCLKV